MNSLESNSLTATTPVGARPTLPAPAEGSTLKLGLFALLALVLIVLGAIAGFIPRWKQRSALRAETSELSVPTVTIVHPTPGQAAPALTLSAEVKPFVEAPIYARANGYLKRWLADMGTTVTAGQLLAEIDTPELNQQLTQARAELTQADAGLALAKLTATRWTSLLKSASVSQQETAEKEADVELKSATVEAMRANVGRLEDLQAFARVTAPFAGTITSRKTDVGQLVVANSAKELFLLAQISTLRVYVHVPQSAARSITVGQHAELTIPEVQGRVFPARVVRTAGAVAADSRTLLTELEVENPRNEILAGSYAQVRFTDARLDPVLTLPSNALIFRAEGPQMAVVTGNGKVELRPVTLGRDLGQSLEILGGVSPADDVILNPADSLVSGGIVRIAETKAASGK